MSFLGNKKTVLIAPKPKKGTTIIDELLPIMKPENLMFKNKTKGRKR